MSDDFISVIIVALAKTWDSKLPGFRDEFRTNVGILRMQTPVSELPLRDALDKLIGLLGEP